MACLQDAIVGVDQQVVTHPRDYFSQADAAMHRALQAMLISKCSASCLSGPLRGVVM